ncbi:hypothetical protein GYMLUDRAFT_90661 [Collybiopsis luxurians FD-317 M1]|nr:hypothetical protein GYMLUDRAFT_90661 [Collybiopsis luxurians FD-317 M1]
MGDLSMGLAYLCGGCCCFKDSDPGPEGSQLPRTKKHPKEKEIDDAFFRRRQYRKDQDGTIRFIPTVSEQPEGQVGMQKQPKETSGVGQG